MFWMSSVLKKHIGHRYKNIESFDAAFAPAGLLRRYANGRCKTVVMRGSVLLIMSLFAAIFLSPHVALLVATIVLAVDLFEFAVLRYWIVRDEFHLPAASRCIFLVSAVQALGIGACIFSAGILSDELRILAWTILLGATINSMLVAHYHPASNRARLCVLSSSAFGVLVWGFYWGDIGASVFWIDSAALVMIALMLWKMFSHLARRDARTHAAERALILRSKEAERLALVARYASDSVLLMDSSLRIVWANQQFTRTTGFSGEFAVGKNPGEFLNHPDTSQETVAQLLKASQNNESVKLRILNKTRDGRAIWMKAHQAPVIDADDEVTAFIAVERDVTDMVAREKQLNLALVAAEEADREKAAFLSRMSHELRTPANGILGGMEILRETEVCDVQGEALAILDTSAKRLMDLIDNVLTMVGTQTGTIKTQFEEVRIKDIIGAIMTQHRKDVDDKNLILMHDISQNARCAMRTDASVIHGVLDKLVSNAVKFTSYGHILIKARLNPDNWLHISVVDTGVGIPKGKVAEIFDAFGQVDDRDTRSFDGAGLGLATAKNLASLLGGRIRVSSVLGEGSTFKLKIPVEPVESHADKATPMALSGEKEITPEMPRRVEPLVNSEPKKQPQIDTSSLKEPENGMGQMRLLVAEDNRTNRMLIKSMLKSAGHNIVFAEDGEQAVAQYIENRPDFVLMDLSMPNKNGLDATREIRAFEQKDSLPRCPIVAVTENVTKEDQKKCFDVGMDGFLPKPVRKDKLLETIVHIAGSPEDGSTVIGSRAH